MQGVRGWPSLAEKSSVYGTLTQFLLYGTFIEYLYMVCVPNVFLYTGVRGRLSVADDYRDSQQLFRALWAGTIFFFRYIYIYIYIYINIYIYMRSIFFFIVVEIIKPRWRIPPNVRYWRWTGGRVLVEFPPATVILFLLILAIIILFLLIFYPIYSTYTYVYIYVYICMYICVPFFLFC